MRLSPRHADVCHNPARAEPVLWTMQDYVGSVTEEKITSGPKKLQCIRSIIKGATAIALEHDQLGTAEAMSISKLERTGLERDNGKIC